MYVWVIFFGQDAAYSNMHYRINKIRSKNFFYQLKRWSSKLSGTKILFLKTYNKNQKENGTTVRRQVCEHFGLVCAFFALNWTGKAVFALCMDPSLHYFSLKKKFEDLKSRLKSGFAFLPRKVSL